MSEEKNKTSKKSGICNQYRDWLIPAVLFSGIAGSVFLFTISVSKITIVLIIAAGLSLCSTVSFLLSLLWSVTRLEAIEVLDKQAKKDKGFLYLFTIQGIILFYLSITVLCFWKSYILGALAVLIFIISIITFVNIIKLQHKTD
jgi:hypothetical protein